MLTAACADIGAPFPDTRSVFFPGDPAPGEDTSSSADTYEPDVDSGPDATPTDTPQPEPDTEPLDVATDVLDLDLPEPDSEDPPALDEPDTDDEPDATIDAAAGPACTPCMSDADGDGESPSWTKASRTRSRATASNDSSGARASMAPRSCTKAVVTGWSCPERRCRSARRRERAGGRWRRGLG
ncbi:MAG: hypothetical protein IV100_10105 [Myxococcales bacterium]|nr:hypothetical protein [Myxococcales bacterium]